MRFRTPSFCMKVDLAEFELRQGLGLAAHRCCVWVPSTAQYFQLVYISLLLLLTHDIMVTRLLVARRHLGTLLSPSRSPRESRDSKIVGISLFFPPRSHRVENVFAYIVKRLCDYGFYGEFFSNSRLSGPPSYVSHSGLTHRENPNECSQFPQSLKCPSLRQIWPCPVVLNLTQSPDEGKGIMYFILQHLQNIHWCHKVRSSVKMIWHHRPVWSCLGLQKFFIQSIRQIFCDTFHLCCCSTN